MRRPGPARRHRPLRGAGPRPAARHRQETRAHGHRRRIHSRAASPCSTGPPASRAIASSSPTRPPSGRARSRTWPGRRRSPRTRRRSRPPAGSSGRRARRSAPARPASRTSTRPGPAASSPASPSPPSTSGWTTFDTAKKIFETAKEKAVGPVILELARSEQTYTWQRVFEYAPNCLAGAIAAGWVGPVFIQGDHYQFNAKKYAADPEAVTEEIRKACRDAVAAGYLNIDIDSSTLVDLSKETVDEQQRVNYTRAAEITALIRDLEPEGVTISVGGEIGEVGKQNSNEAELRAYLDGFRRELDARAPGRGRRQQGQRPDRHQPRRRAAAGRRRRRGQARLRGPPRPRRGRPARTAPPAPSSTARAPCPTISSTRSRPSRRPRSTSRRASRTRSTTTRPSRPSSMPRSRRGATPTPPTSARKGRPTASSSTRRARRRSGPSSGGSGASRRRARSWPARP